MCACVFRPVSVSVMPASLSISLAPSLCVCSVTLTGITEAETERGEEEDGREKQVSVYCAGEAVLNRFV